MNLKDIAVSAFASDALATETWSDMVKFCVKWIETSTFETLCAALTECEEQMKAEYDTKVMPPAWRSAKSVVLNALAEEIGLIDGAIVRGKTAVEKDIKNKRLRKEGVATDEDVALDIAQQAREKLRKLIGHTALGNSTVQQVLTECDVILKTLRS